MRMDQIFTDNYRFMVGGLVAATIMAYLPYQSRWGLRLSRTVLFLAGLYPISITYLYLNQNDCGESYAYLVLGGLITILFGIIAALLTFIWLIVFIRGMLWSRKDATTKQLSNYASESIRR